jgi:hypothetical protein
MNNTDRLRLFFEKGATKKGYCFDRNELDGRYVDNFLQEGWELFTLAYNEIEPKDNLKKQLSDLLAIVHRDGGHHEEKHGTEKSVNDAILKVAANHSVIDALRSKDGNQ